MHSQIEAILKSIKQQLAAIYALDVKDDLKMWSSGIYAQNVEKLSPRGSSYMLWMWLSSKTESVFINAHNVDKYDQLINIL